jgi:hypothetical protein
LAIREVAITRSEVGTSVVYGSSRNPWNSEPVDFRMVRSFSPPVTQVCCASPVPSTVMAASLTSWPLRIQVWSCSTPSMLTRSQANSSISIRAPSTGSTSST